MTLTQLMQYIVLLLNLIWKFTCQIIYTAVWLQEFYANKNMDSKQKPNVETDNNVVMTQISFRLIPKERKLKLQLQNRSQN